MTLVTRASFLRPRSHENSLRRLPTVEQLLDRGLLTDEEGRTLVRLDPLEVERRLKARGSDD